jgi:hypothetical protein
MYVPKGIIGGPARRQKSRAGAAFLPQAPLTTFFGDIHFYCINAVRFAGILTVKIMLILFTQNLVL